MRTKYKIRSISSCLCSIGLKTLVALVVCVIKKYRRQEAGGKSLEIWIRIVMKVESAFRKLRLDDNDGIDKEAWRRTERCPSLLEVMFSYTVHELILYFECHSNLTILRLWQSRNWKSDLVVYHLKFDRRIHVPIEHMLNIN